jgi:hypothetical protein
MIKLKKGSAAAKAYMAKIRAKRGKPKKVGKKAAPKVLGYTKAPKRKVGALPVGFTGKFWGVPFKIFNQFDIYGQVTANIEDTNNGKLIVEVTDRIKLPGQIQAFKNYIATAAKVDAILVDTKRLEKDSKDFITNLYNEVKKYNEGKTGTTKAKKGINVKVVKRPGSTAHVKTNKTTLRENLKSEGLKLTHGYNLANRAKIGTLTTDRIRQSLELITTYEDNLKTYLESTGGKFNTKDFKATRAKFIKFYRASLKEEKIHLKELKKLI